MAETREPDLLGINPVDDTEASRYLSADAHTWLRESIGSGAGPEHVRRPHRRVLLAPLLLATVVALIVILPGLLSSNGSVTQPPLAQAQILHRITTALTRKPETILVQRTQIQFFTTRPGGVSKPASRAVSSLTIDEASQEGSVQRSFTTSSDQPAGFEQLSAENSLQIYDPTNDTIYETTPAAWQTAVQRSFRFPPLSDGSHASTTFFSSTGPDSTGPGQLSVFAQRLRRHLYRLGGTTRIDGRAALTLVPVRRRITLPSRGNGLVQEFLGTVYVSPSTYYPIKEVTRIPSAGSPLGTAPGAVATVVNQWSEYRVLPATRRNAALVSLTARHPHARIVHGAEAYLRASARESHP